MKYKIILSGLLLICTFSAGSHPYLRLPAAIGDGMVLQREKPVRIWGWSEPRTRITVTAQWSADTLRTTVGGTSRWSVELKTPAAGGPYWITITANDVTRRIEDVLIGDVWLCSGQSNMALSPGTGARDSIAPDEFSRDDLVRLFKVPRCASDTPQDDVPGQWARCDDENLQWFSAVGASFGRRLASELHIPIGLVDSSSGGTAVEAWTPSDIILSNPAFVEGHKKLPAGAWDTGIGTTYNAMLHPLLAMCFAGVIWYQGEANVPNCMLYRELLTGMIGTWRGKFGYDVPFYLIQIAPFSGYRRTYGFEGGGSRVRQAQLETAFSVPDCGVICIDDLTDHVGTIHPPHKHAVGRRMAHYVLADRYGFRETPHRSPRFRSVEFRGTKAYVDFYDVGEGLEIRNDRANTLEICGRDRVFVPAEGRIDHQKRLVVYSPEITEPVAVRYSFRDDAVGRLFSSEGLPVFPFRTDDDEPDVPASD